MDQLKTTREFWDSNPCGLHADFISQRRQRYLMEPWLPHVLGDMAASHISILEVGCGQGIDSTVLCAAMAPGGRYQGIDYSPASVEVARSNAAALAEVLAVSPAYRVGNAEALDFPDADFDAVYSMGVIHHTANDSQAIKEVHRVLKPGGTAYVFLYRRYALKVLVAQILRAIQAGMDELLGTDRCVYKWLRQSGSSNRWFGTMLLECFGVPYMKWYSRAEIMALFADFPDIELSTIGSNFGRIAPWGCHRNRGGYFWAISARK